MGETKLDYHARGMLGGSWDAAWVRESYKFRFVHMLTLDLLSAVHFTVIFGDGVGGGFTTQLLSFL